MPSSIGGHQWGAGSARNRSEVVRVPVVQET